MKQLKHPHDIRTCNKGTNIDLDKELHNTQEGDVVDRHNMRTMPMDGDNESSKKIGGEEVLYPNIDNRCNGGSGLPLSVTYECVGVVEVNDRIVEFWADDDNLDPSLIRIDGLIVLYSSDFPITTDFPLQIAKNESCIGGEVYITDFNVIPMFFNVEDLLLNSNVDVGDQTGSCEEKYFTEFNIDEQTLQLTRTLEHPVFIKLTTAAAGFDEVLGSTGLPVGYVTYSHRYVTDDGERTSWSAPTPQIPIVKAVSSNCVNYPWVKTISKDPDISVPSIYGAHVRLRIDNSNNYDFIELRRDSWVAGDPLGNPATSEVAGKIDVAAGQFGIMDILDKGGSEEILSEEDIISTMSSIARAKAIRYFNQRLYLMNVEYESRNVDDSVDMIDEGLATVAFPVIQKLGKAGHSDPYKAAYHKSTMRGEKHGYGIILWDDQGQYTFAKDIVGAENILMPNRRVPTSALTEGASYEGTVRAADINGDVNQTHEVFDLVDAVGKDDACLFANILEAGSKSEGDVNEVTVPPYNCDPIDPSLVTVGQVQGDNLGYRPWTPVSQDSQACNHLNFWNNTSVGTTDATLEGGYAPNGFEPNYYSAGMAFKGVETLPTWAKAFSIVRTPPATKVIAQGLGYYSMKSAGSGIGTNTEKKNDELAVYFPDLDEQTGIDPTIIDSIKADPTAFAIQVVSPLGFFTEVATYLDRAGLGGSRDKGADMITYCRILRDDTVDIDQSINSPFADESAMGIEDAANAGHRYVGYSKWRTPAFSGSEPFTGGGGGNTEIDITNVIDYTSQSGRMKYFRVQLGSPIYEFINTNGDDATNEDGVKNFHEPIYVVNIVRKEADVAQQNSQRYDFAGHYQKVEATIGISDGQIGQSHLLVDERWEDVRQNIDGEVQNDYAALHRFVFIRDILGNEKRWLNIDNISGVPLTTILDDIDNNGFANVADASGSFTVYGVYTTSQTTDFTAPIFSVDFEYLFPAYPQGIFIPQAENEIVVKYDNRIPVRVFGGDTWINESIWAVKDKEYTKGGENIDESTLDEFNGIGDFRLNVAWPFKRFEINERHFIIKNATAGVGKIQDENVYNVNPTGIKPSSLRQLIAMWTAETKINLSFSFNDEGVLHSSLQQLPLKNYVMRPHQWDDDQFASGATAAYADNNIFADYETDYGDEYLNWQFGGYRFLPQVNLDYSKKDNTRAIASVPELGFEEQNEFCTRIIWSARRPINVQDTPSIRTFPT
ncbi:MAG: hypothetical protein ACXAB7_09940, partial [Candidatus Kariarchaeaceae archaeon]